MGGPGNRDSAARAGEAGAAGRDTAASRFELRLEDKTVTWYETLDEAEESMEWYVRTYGETTEPLTVVEVPA